MSILTKILLSFLACLVLAVGGTSTYAIWIYAKDPAEGAGAQGTVGMAAFEYAPEEVLPDTPEDDVAQTNHWDIIWELLFNQKMGMNMGKGDRMEAEIAEHGLLHYLENVQGGNLKHLIDVTEGGKNLGFSLEYIDDENFWAYTYYRLQHEEGQEIIVYRTLFSRNYDKSYDLNKDGKTDVWKAATSIMGAAKVTRYSSEQFKPLTETWREV